MAKRICLICAVKPAGNCHICKVSYCETHRVMAGQFTTCDKKSCARRGRAKFNKEHKKIFSGTMHKKAHALQKLLKKNVPTGQYFTWPTTKPNGLPGKPRKVKETREEWRFTGWDAIRKAEAWVDRTRGVYNVGLDDDMATSSALIVVPHEDRKTYHGATFMFIPQCTGEKPIRFFMYDHSVVQLMKVLKKLHAKHKKKGYK